VTRRSRTSPRDPNSIHKRGRHWLRPFGESRDCRDGHFWAFPRASDATRVRRTKTKTPLRFLRQKNVCSAALVASPRPSRPFKARPSASP
jgi:hypothetical protein